MGRLRIIKCRLGSWKRFVSNRLFKLKVVEWNLRGGDRIFIIGV